MIRRERVKIIRRLATRGWGIKSIARELDVSHVTVRRYARHPFPAGRQIRPKARRLTTFWRRVSEAVFRGSAAGNASAVYRLVTRHGIRVSLRTVQRVVAQLRPPEDESDNGPAHRPMPTARDLDLRHSALTPGSGMSEEAELQLAKGVAKARGGLDSDELESELTLHVARLRARGPSRVKDWKAFLITALHRDAGRWLRQQRRAIRRTTSLDRAVIQDDDQAATLKDFLAYAETALEDRTALALVRDELDPKLRAVWDALWRTDGKQVHVAKQLHKHRNTLRVLIRQIRDISKRHGF